MNKRIMSILVISATIVAIIVGFAAFGSDDEINNTSETSQANNFPLNLELVNLSKLEQGIYEGWIIRGNDKFSFGTFNTTDTGAIDGILDLNGVEPQNGDTVVVTIEPTPDDNSDPSGVVILSGELVNGSASLAYSLDVSDFSGSYILATPTNGDDTNETSGIWFLDPSDLSASLNIPDAPEGWIYEGWVVSQGIPVTSGQFKSASGFDLFDGFSGSDAGPPFPGEDYLNNLPDGLSAPLELADGDTMIVVSIEPDINGVDPTGDGPAQVKPLTALIAKDAADHTLFDLTFSSSTIPSGSASL